MPACLRAAWAAQLDHAIAVIEAAIKGCRRLAIDGTAVGARLKADPAMATFRRKRSPKPPSGGSVSGSVAAEPRRLSQASISAARTVATPTRTTSSPDDSTAPAATGAGEFASDQQARAHCPSDMVVWVNTRSGVYHFAGTHNYGHTKEGAYMCEADAKAAGDRAAMNAATAVSERAAAAPSSPP